MTTTRILSVAAAAALACTERSSLAGTPSAPAPRAVEAVQASAPAAAPVRVPLTVKWVPRAALDGRLELTARLEFYAPIQAPLRVEVALPPGVTLVEGRTPVEVLPGPDLLPIDLPFAFAVAPGADGEIVLSASIRGPTSGVYAKDTYPLAARLQAPAPAPQPFGPSLKIGRHDLGSAVPIAPPQR